MEQEDPDSASASSLQAAMEDPDSAWLQAAMDIPVTVSLGPMGPLLKQLCSVMASEHSRLKRVKAEIQLLGEGLGELCTGLKDVSEAEDTSLTAKCWMRQIRELCFDTTDYLDEVMHSLQSGARAGTRRRPHLSAKTKIFRIPIKVKRLPCPRRRLLKRGPQIAKDISALMARVEYARESRKRFQLEVLTNELLVKLLAFDDNNQKQLKVVPIFGFAGVGKTKVARTIYHQYGGKFQCRAFLRVSRDPDLRRLLTTILSQIKAPPAHAFSDVQGLIDSIREHLQSKRYFIIIDDLWTTPVWDIISRAFPDGNCCSRIITTTQIEDVALACCSYDLKYIFEMSPLNDDQSGKFESGCANPSSKGMKETLKFIYDTLPPHLKTCLLYLNIYPEGDTVMKDELVKQWIAEGFIGAVKGQNIADVAGGYFDDLVRRGMIQSVDTNYSGEVLSCTVHHLVLDLIRYKSIEENFITIVDYLQTIRGLPDKVRRLSVQFGGAKGAKVPESIRTSQVRSLLFRGFFNCVPSIVEYGLLRVLILHIWADQEKIFDLSRIGELFRLRYLKIECNMTIKLPAKIGGLPYLETLEIDARLPDVPSDIVHLENLLHLRLPSEANLPHGVGHMTSLRTLGYFDLGSNSEGNVLDIGKLTNIQDLHLTCSTVQTAYNPENNMKCLGSILGKLSSLKCLALVPAAGSSSVNTLQGDAGASSMRISCDGLSIVSTAPAHLQRLEVSRRCCIFPSIPKWFGELSKLCILKIAVWELSKEDIDILKELPVLTSLSLYIQSAPADRLVIEDKEGFPVLTYFKFMCTAPCLSFMEGAMPNVRKLKLGFNANRMNPHSLVDAGFKCLTGLKEISLKLEGAGADESDRRAAESALQAAVRLHRNTLISRVQCVDVIFDGEEDKSNVIQGQKQLTLRMHQDIEESKMEHPSQDVNEEIHSGISTKSESSSHLQNPVAEHKTIAIYGMVSASTGAMNSLLSKLAILIWNEYAKLRGKQVEVMILKKELDAMNAVFEQLANIPGLNMEMKRLRNQMREMTYDVEDWIDDLMLQFQDDLHKATGYPEKWDVLEEFIHQIRNLTAQAEKADLPGILERTEIQTLQSSYKATESGLHTLYNKAVGLVSIDGPRDELLKRMNGGEQQLQVACILGSGGLGKTALATEVYNHVKGPFDCRVFVQVPRNIDITRLHKVILWQLRRQPQVLYYWEKMDEASLIDKVRRYLRDKRYLIVIDGVWSARTWELLRSALPEDKYGSRILMTTNDTDIAESCKKHSSDFTYCLLPLPPRESLRLFGGILFGSDRSYPMELQKVAEKILAACGGIPMAIIIMAGILASKPVEAAEWKMVEKRMELVAGDGDVSKEIIRKMFHISYSGLPRDIKSCLLYLSVFPENQFIRKDRLIWRWIAEGFVPKRSGESSWETGERYFLELIVRNLIEPVYEEENEEEKDDYEVPVGCKVHGLILEFITSLSNEENLVTTMAEATDVQHGVIRRLTVSVSYSNQEEDHYSRLISTQGLSKVRSITILEVDQIVYAPSRDCWWSLLLGSRFLRVLDLEDAKSLRYQHLEGTIEGLVLLRYLGLAGTHIYRLPEEIGKVEQLETLDLRRTFLRTLPASIASLQKLVRLLVDPKVQLPSEMSKMQELEQVSTISSSSLNSVAELLVKSKPLRMLDVYFGDRGIALRRNLYRTSLITKRGKLNLLRESITSFLRMVGNSNLQSLSLRCGDYYDESVLGILVDSWEAPPRHLRRFKLEIRILGVIPPRMASLVSVTHLHIRIIGLEAGGVRVLGDLPNLVLLDLTARISTRCVISGEKAFQCLKVFTLRCLGVGPSQGGMGLEFTTAAMPQLQRLRLYFSARETLSLCGGFDFGIQHLSCLARLHATIYREDATVEEVEAAEAAIRRQVSEFPIKPTVEFSRWRTPGWW